MLVVIIIYTTSAVLKRIQRLKICLDRNISAHHLSFSLSKPSVLLIMTCFTQEKVSELAGHAVLCVPARCHRFTPAFRDKTPHCHQLLSSNLYPPLLSLLSYSLFLLTFSLVFFSNACSLLLISTPCFGIPLFSCIFPLTNCRKLECSFYRAGITQMYTAFARALVIYST